jgi:protein TonB
MLRLSLFLLLSLALHIAGWQLQGAAHPPALSTAEASAAPQVLRLAAVLQQAAPTAQAPRPVAVPSKIPATTPSPSRVVAKPRPVHAVQPAQSQSVPTQAAPTQGIPAQPFTEVLSHKPSFRQPPRPPSYPSQARRRNQQGVVVVEVRLDARGQQRSLHVLRSSGIDSLDRAALDAIAEWVFRPETTHGQAVPSRVQIPIRFALTASR